MLVLVALAAAYAALTVAMVAARHKGHLRWLDVPALYPPRQ